jgi:drug/metabolite transporter (DMT)-like permease
MVAVSLGLFAAFCWSLHDLLARHFAPGIGPYRLALSVVVLGGVFLLVPVAANGTLWTGGMAGIPQAAALGACYAIAIGSLLKAFSIAPVSVVGPFTAPYPALVVIWGVINGLAPTLADCGAILAIIIGAIIVARFGHEDGGMNRVAAGQMPTLMVCCALACFSFAASTVFGQASAQSLGGIEATFVSRWPAALLLLPLAMREKPVAATPSRGPILAASAMGLFDVAAVTAINIMGGFPNKEFGAMAISAYGAIAVLLATVLLKEKVSPGQWAGIALIAAGVSYLTYAGK